MADRPIAALLLAAGKGTRMRSELPKVLHPLLGQPLLAHPVQTVLALGARPVVVVVGFGAEDVKAAFAHAELRFVVQAEQLGTGHAALQARPILHDFTGDILIMPGDAPLLRAETLKALLQHHRKEDASLTVLTTSLPDALHYGRIVRDAEGHLERIVEAKDADPVIRAIREINSGVYLVKAEFLFAALARVGNQNAQGEYYLTDIVGLGRAGGHRLSAYLHADAGELAGVNDRLELAAAEVWLQQHQNQRLMRAGVSFEQPDSIRVEVPVQVEADVSLGAGVQLRGHTRVARGVRVEPGAILTDCMVGQGCHIGAYSVLTGLELEARTRVPPLTLRTQQGRR